MTNTADFTSPLEERRDAIVVLFYLALALVVPT
jgi:hypothetical protein